MSTGDEAFVLASPEPSSSDHRRALEGFPFVVSLVPDSSCFDAWWPCGCHRCSLGQHLRHVVAWGALASDPFAAIPIFLGPPSPLFYPRNSQRIALYFKKKNTCGENKMSVKTPVCGAWLWSRSSRRVQIPVGSPCLGRFKELNPYSLTVGLCCSKDGLRPSTHGEKSQVTFICIFHT